MSRPRFASSYSSVFPGAFRLALGTTLALTAALTLMTAAPVHGESAVPRFVASPWPAAVGAPLGETGITLRRVAPPQPARLAEAAALAPFAVLAPASAGARDELDALKIWNLAGRNPLKNGFSRPLPEPLAVRLTPGAAAEHAAHLEGRAATAVGQGWLRWAARVRVDEAYRLRLHLARVRLPAAAQLWVYGGDGAPGVAFGRELAAPAGDLWTPSVAGPEITLELRLPAPAGGAAAAGAAFDLDRVAEIVGPERLGLSGAARRTGAVTPSADDSCLIDGSCVSSATLGIIDSYRHAVGELFFMVDGSGFACTGGLLADLPGSGTPYLLTANHCISTQAAASSLQVFWDYTTSSCNGAAPALDSLPQSDGATLLATSLTSDFAFLQLASLPANRFFLGWTTAAVADRTVLSRLSHPCPGCPNGGPLSQAYSATFRTVSPVFVCGLDQDGRDWSNQPDFLYSAPDRGATFPGSSGSPELDPAGLVVGQLLGTCGSANGNAFPCLLSSQYDLVDGAFAVTFPAIARWLIPGSCVADAATLCIDDQPGDGRFKVQAPFHTSQGGGLSGQAHPVALGSLGVDRGGLFWFFSPDNPELLIKVLNGCALDGHYWVFLSAGTNAGLTVTVTDTRTGKTWTRTNADGTPVPSVQDTGALACGQ